MKKHLPLLVLLLAVAGIAWGQSDTVRRSPVDTAAFDPSAVAVPTDDYDDFTPPDDLSSGRRNPIYYFGHNFSTIFMEMNLLVGNDVAFGLSGSYVPEVWGGYVTFMEGIYNHWLSGGAEYRLSTPWSKYDWHLFGGLAYGFESDYNNDEEKYGGMGGEFGVRFAPSTNFGIGKFSTLSCSLALRATVDGFIGVNFGFSIGLLSGLY